MSSTGTVTTTQKAQPWETQQPFLNQLYQGAQALPERQFFPGSTVAPFSSETEQALQLGRQRALAGSPVQTAGQEQLANTLRGDYLYGGPGFDAAFNAAQRRITPAVQGQFEGAGRFGGGLSQEAETAALSDAFAGLYNQERNRQLAGLGQVPAMAALDYADIGALAGVGAQRDLLSQRQIDEDMARFNFGQNEPYERLAAQSDIIQRGYPGSSQTAETPYFKNPLGTALGALALGAGAFDLGGKLGVGGSDGGAPVGPAATAASNVLGSGVGATQSLASGLGGPAVPGAGFAAPGSQATFSGPGGGSIFGNAQAPPLPTDAANTIGLGAGGAAIPGLGTIAGTTPAGAPVTGALANEIVTTGAVGGAPAGATSGGGILSGGAASTFGNIVAPAAIGGLMLQGILSQGETGEANTRGTQELWQQIQSQPNVTINGATGKQFEFAGKDLLGIPGSFVVLDPNTKELFTMDFTKQQLSPIKDMNQVLNSPISGGLSSLSDLGGAVRNIYSAFGIQPPEEKVESVTNNMFASLRARREDSLGGRG